MENQLSLFQVEEGSQNLINIRSEQQIFKKISYDAGEYISGSRKEIAALKREFEEKSSSIVLEEIEELSPVLAAQLITRNELFKGFSLKQEKENGTEPSVARAKQLLIQRVDTAPQGDSKECRLQFLKAVQYFLDCMQSVHKMDDLYTFLHDMADYVYYERFNPSYCERQLQEIQNELPTLNQESEEYKKLYRKEEKMKGNIRNIQRAQELCLSSLGEKFCNFFKNKSSYRSTLTNALKVESWDELLEKKEKNTGAKRKTAVWERQLPERPDRIGGAMSTIEKPEELLSFFQFRGVQFGNYVEDDKGMEHLLRSSEAMMDLAEILGIEYISISHNGSLAISYGARGRGKAWGHFEPFSNVINMTKEKGCLGIFAHEWFHSYDNYIFRMSHEFKNGKIGYASELGNLGTHVDPLVPIFFAELMDLIKKGNSVDYYENKNTPGASWRGTSFKKAYQRHNGDLFSAMKEQIATQKASLRSSIKFYSNYSYNDQKSIEKLEKRTEREIKQFAQALAWYHEQETGERVDRIPYPSDKSDYLQASIILDKQKLGKYWSSDCELAARAFEAFIEDKLKALRRKSDYLVCGTNDSQAFPMGEERKAINQKFEEMFNYFKENKLI